MQIIMNCQGTEGSLIVFIISSLRWADGNMASKCDGSSSATMTPPSIRAASVGSSGSRPWPRARVSCTCTCCGCSSPCARCSLPRSTNLLRRVAERPSRCGSLCHLPVGNSATPCSLRHHTSRQPWRRARGSLHPAAQAGRPSRGIQLFKSSGVWYIMFIFHSSLFGSINNTYIFHQYIGYQIESKIDSHILIFTVPSKY